MKYAILMLVCFSSTVGYCREWSMFAADKPAMSKPCDCKGKTPCQCEDCKCEKPKHPHNRMLMFTATWCGPCQSWKRDEVPALKEAGWIIGTQDTAHIQVIDTDQNPEKTQRYGITSIPHFVMIRPDGTEVDRSSYMSASQTADFYYANQEQEP